MAAEAELTMIVDLHQVSLLWIRRVVARKATHFAIHEYQGRTQFIDPLESIVCIGVTSVVNADGVLPITLSVANDFFLWLWLSLLI